MALRPRHLPEGRGGVALFENRCDVYARGKAHACPHIAPTIAIMVNRNDSKPLHALARWAGPRVVVITIYLGGFGVVGAARY